MAEVIETLIVKIEGDLSELRGDLKKSSALVRVNAAGMAKSAVKATRAFTALAASAIRLSTGLGVATASFLAIRKAVRAFSETDMLAKTADRLGLTTEALAGLQLAASQTGVEARILETSLQRLNRRLAEVATTGGGVAKKGLDALGLSAEELLKLPLEEQFGLIGDRLNGLSSQAQKTQIAFGFFDTEGGKLLNTLRLGSKGLEDFREEAQKLGLAISRVDAARVEAANDQIDKMLKAFSGVARTLAVKLSPAIEQITKELTGTISEANKAGSSFDTVAKGLIGGFNLAQKAVAGFKIGLNAARVGIGMLAELAVKGADVGLFAFRRFQAGVSGLGMIAVDVANAFVQGFQLISKIAGETWAVIKAGADIVANSVVVIFEKARASITTVVRAIRAAFAAALDITSTVVAAGEGFINVREGLSTDMRNAATDLQVAIQRERRAAESGVEAAKAGLNQAVAGFNEAKEALLSPEDTPVGSETLVEMSKGLEALTNAQLRAAENGDAVTQSLAENLALIQQFTQESQKGLQASITEAGGISTVDAAIAEFEQLRDLRDREFALEVQQRTEHNKQLQEMEMQRAARDKALKQSLLGQLFSLEQEHLDRTRELWNRSLEGRAQALGTFFSNLAVLQESENRKAFEVGKAAAIAEAGVNTFLAATKAYQALAGIPVVGPGLGALAAAAAIYAGYINIQKIRQMQFKGGAGAAAGGSVAAPPPTSGGGGGIGQGQGGEGATPIQSQQFNISLEGERFSGDQVRTLIAQINDQLSDNASLQVG